MASQVEFTSETNSVWIGGATSYNRFEGFMHAFCASVDLRTGHCRRIHVGPWNEDLVYTLRIRNGGDLAAFCTNLAVYICSVASASVLHRLEFRSAGRADALAWSPCGQFLAVAGRDNIAVWDAQGKPAAKMLSRTSRGNIAWSPTGLRLGFVEKSGEPCILSLERIGG